MIWKPLHWLDPRYEVSNKGAVRSWANSHGGVAHAPRNKTQVQAKSGYMYVGLVVAGVPRTYTVHRLVLRAFTALHEAQVNHKDGNKANNCVTNLEWVTRSENMRRAYQTMHIPPPTGGRGVERPRLQKCVAQLHTNRALVRVWPSITAACRAGYSPSAISNVLSGRAKTHAGFVWSFS
jgi:hypothetical protein